MKFFLVVSLTMSLLYSCTTDDNLSASKNTQSQPLQDITGENIALPSEKDSVVVVIPPVKDSIVVVIPPVVKDTIIKFPINPIVVDPIIFEPIVVEPIVVTPPIIENSINECIYTLPDAQGGDSGNGFTCTGLFYDKKESRNSTNNLIFWVGNHGGNRQSASNRYFTSSLVKIEIDNTIQGKGEAKKLAELDMSEITNNGTIQGVVVDKFDTLWFVSFGHVINVTKSGLELDRFYIKGANGLAYDAVNDYFFVKPDNISSVYMTDRKGNVIKSIFVHSTIDQMFYDAEKKILYGGLGTNGRAGSLKSYDVVFGGEVATYGPYAKVLASEGVSIVGDYLYYASDAYYHPAPIPSLEINAIHKNHFKP